MLAAIDFHDEPDIHADEIDGIPTERRLPPEAITAQQTIAQMTPQRALSVC
jgi:hypothetical protein